MLGGQLRGLRKQHGLTQEQLANALSCAKSTISQYENGINEPDLEMLTRIADFFGVSLDFLLGRDTYNKRNRDEDRETENSDFLLKERLTPDEAEYLKEALNSLRRWQAKQSERN